MSLRNRKAYVAVTAAALAMASLGFSASAGADPYYKKTSYGSQRAQYDYAPVTNVEPIVRYVTVKTPIRECWTETEYVEVNPRRRSTGGSALVGAIIGGVVGHQFGSGRGNDAATVAGSLIGAAVGSESARQANRRRSTEVYSRPVQRCATTMETHEEERIDGYKVTYRYNGQRYTTEMPYDPGREIRVRVDVRPAS